MITPMNSSRIRMNFPCVCRYVLHVSFDVDHEAEQETEDADDEAGEQQSASRHAHELHRPEVGKDEVGLGFCFGRLTGECRFLRRHGGVRRRV
jgi:hypothetical protein